MKRTKQDTSNKNNYIYLIFDTIVLCFSIYIFKLIHFSNIIFHFFRKTKLSHHVGKNITLKLIKRQIESKDKRLFCSCDIITFINIQPLHVDKQLYCQKQKWISVKRNIRYTQKILCTYHNIEFILSSKQKIIL